MEPLSPPAGKVALPLVTSGKETLDKPRILCLHGAGVNAEVFSMQMRMFLPSLAPHFRLVFVNAPYPSEMHPALAIVYDEFGPYFRWGGWLPHHPSRDAELVISELEERLTATMRADEEGTGEWVGILGFSQGAKLAVSILIENQRRRQEGKAEGGFAGAWWRFGVLMAGRAKPYALSEETLGDGGYFVRPGDAAWANEWGASAAREGAGEEEEKKRRLGTPTLHVHGLQDPGLEEHRVLLRDFCREDSAVLIEWNDGHRLPYRSWDVNAVVEGILKVAEMGGVQI